MEGALHGVVVDESRPENPRVVVVVVVVDGKAGEQHMKDLGEGMGPHNRTMLSPS